MPLANASLFFESVWGTSFRSRPITLLSPSIDSPGMPNALATACCTLASPPLASMPVNTAALTGENSTFPSFSGLAARDWSMVMPKWLIDCTFACSWTSRVIIARDSVFTGGSSLELHAIIRLDRLIAKIPFKGFIILYYSSDWFKYVGCK